MNDGRRDGALSVALVDGPLGIFGGSFDPIHVAHLAVAEEAAGAVGLERVLFVPAADPPHKPDAALAPAEDRLRMVGLAIADNPRFAVSRLELDRPGPSYTVDTLEAVAAARAAAGLAGDLHLILSVEAFRGLPTWREPRRILDLARLVVAPRDGYADATAADLGAWFPDIPDAADRVVLLDGPRLRLSATTLRERVAAGRSVRYLVPDAVRAYIGDHGLYATPRRTTAS